MKPALKVLLADFDQRACNSWSHSPEVINDTRSVLPGSRDDEALYMKNHSELNMLTRMLRMGNSAMVCHAMNKMVNPPLTTAWCFTIDEGSTTRPE
jgi:hypothetical protein